MPIDDRPGMWNRASGDLTGNLAQVNTVHGDVRFESTARPGFVATRALPRDSRTFTGREPEFARLRELAETAADGGVAIATIDGMPGVGKTAFAVHAAHLLATLFPDGHLFLRLHGYTPGQRPTEAVDALGTLLLAIGVDAEEVPAGVEARSALWRARSSGKSLLIVLDDATSTEQVDQLLPGDTGSLVLVTSRRRLTRLVDAVPITLEILSPRQARDLFVRLTGRPDPDAAQPDVDVVVRLCGYLPLAIGLMAGRLKHHPTWTVADLAAELASVLDRPTVLQAENVSVAAAFDLSYQGLDADGQRMFRLIGGQFGIEVDAYAAAALGGTDLRTGRRHLDDLYSHHLLDEPVRGRYRLHDLLREYARSGVGVETAGEGTDAAERLLAYYRHAAWGAAHRLNWRDKPREPADVPLPPAVPELATAQEATVWLALEEDNLRAAVEYAVVTEDATAAVEISGSLNHFLRYQGRWEEALALQKRVLPLVRRMGDTYGMATTLSRMGVTQALLGNFPAAIADQRTACELYRSIRADGREGWTLFELASVYRAIGDYGEALSLLRSARRIFVRRGDRHEELRILNQISFIERRLGDREAAAASLAEAVALSRHLRGAAGEARGLTLIGSTLRSAGDPAGAIDYLNSALELFHAQGDRFGAANTLRDRGVLHRFSGRYEAAGVDIAAALAIFRDEGSRLEEANTLRELAMVDRLAGNSRAAIDHIGASLEISRELRDRLGEALALCELGVIHRLDADSDMAATEFARALELFRDFGSRPEEARALRELGVVQWMVSDYPAARQSQQAALDLFRALGDKYGEAEALHYLGVVQRMSGQHGDAAASQEAALTLFREQSNRHGEASALREYGIVEAKRRDLDAAEGHLTRALALSRELGDPNGVAWTLLELGALQGEKRQDQSAIRTLEEALELFRRIDSRYGEASARHYVGTVHRRIGDHLAAKRHLEAAVEMFGRIGNRDGEAEALTELGATLRLLGETAAATSRLESALALSREIDDRVALAEVMCEFGRLALATGDLRAARARFEQALTHARDAAAADTEARARDGLVQVTARREE